jgi:FkbH-like protein
MQGGFDFGHAQAYPNLSNDRWNETKGYPVFWQSSGFWGMRDAAGLRVNPTRLALPADVRTAFLQTRAAVKHRSTIIWEEHCTECAFPSCYTSCALYTPREDYHCRRFVQGIEPVRDHESAQLHLRRIQFKRWGKLEGWGPVALKPRSIAEMVQRFDRAAAAALRPPLPRRAIDLATARLKALRRRVAEKGSAPGYGDIFLVEAWNASRSPQPFTLTFLTAGTSQPAIVRYPVTFTPGYSRTAVSVEQIVLSIDLTQRFRVQLEPMVEGAPPLVFGIVDFVRLTTEAAPAASAPEGAKPRAKCVIWDLDNTVWDGILAETGPEGVTPIPTAVATIVELDRRGILNSIASKNDPNLARKALERFGLLSYFVAPQIGWGPKSEAICQIATTLDIGMDTLVFIDDQAFERGEVQALCPGAEALPQSAIAEIVTLERFSVPVTAEGSKRRLMYQTEERRQREHVQSTLDYDAFLRTCAIKLNVQPLAQSDVRRVFELSQRTNQLNVSARRYNIEDIETLMKSPEARNTYVLSCTDRFGDYGVIGFCVMNRSSGLVESFFMSCRVQRKRVEDAFFALLASDAAALGHDVLRIAYCRTDRNGTAVAMLTELGFDYVPADGTQGEFRRATAQSFEHNQIVELSVGNGVDSVRASA